MSDEDQNKDDLEERKAKWRKPLPMPASFWKDQALR